MAQARNNPTARAPDIAAGGRPAPLVVILDKQMPKVHVTRFITEDRPVPYDNLYLKMDGYNQLGRPPKIRVTVEGVWD